MTFTTLRVSHAGVVLYAGHCERLGHAAAAGFCAFAARAAPGVYALEALAEDVLVEQRRGSRLADGMASRVMLSPVGERGMCGASPKLPSPCVYDNVRADGVATLLCDGSGGEIFEACRAAVVGWDGSSLVLVPEDRPRVASLAERHVAASLPHRRAPLLVADSWALLLVNAVGSFAPVFERRPDFPAVVRAAIDSSLESSAWRPAGGAGGGRT